MGATTSRGTILAGSRRGLGRLLFKPSRGPTDTHTRGVGRYPPPSRGGEGSGGPKKNRGQTKLKGSRAGAGGTPPPPEDKAGDRGAHPSLPGMQGDRTTAVTQEDGTRGNWGLGAGGRGPGAEWWHPTANTLGGGPLPITSPGMFAPSGQSAQYHFFSWPEHAILCPRSWPISGPRLPGQFPPPPGGDPSSPVGIPPHPRGTRGPSTTQKGPKTLCFSPGIDIGPF